MRFLVDESCPAALAAALADAGHDLFVVRLAMAGADDRDLADIAIAEDRFVVTLDYDFGELAVREALPIPGVVLVWLPLLPAPEVAERVMAALAVHGDALRDHLTVVQGQRVRRRRLR